MSSAANVATRRCEIGVKMDISATAASSACETLAQIIPALLIAIFVVDIRHPAVKQAYRVSEAQSELIASGLEAKGGLSGLRDRARAILEEADAHLKKLDSELSQVPKLSKRKRREARTAHALYSRDRGEALSILAGIEEGVEMNELAVARAEDSKYSLLASAERAQGAHVKLVSHGIRIGFFGEVLTLLGVFSTNADILLWAITLGTGAAIYILYNLADLAIERLLGERRSPKPSRTHSRAAHLLLKCRPTGKSLLSRLASHTIDRLLLSDHEGLPQFNTALLSQWLMLSLGFATVGYLLLFLQIT